MSTLRTMTEPQELDLLVTFFDLTGFARYARKRTNREVLDALSTYYELIGDHVEPSGGAVRSEERRVGKECRSRWSP